jgi:hypothetical protein
MCFLLFALSAFIRVHLRFHFSCNPTPPPPLRFGEGEPEGRTNGSNTAAKAVERVLDGAGGQ